MWSKGTDMVQGDTPAFALHLWTRVQPLVSVRDVAALGASKPWETIALACLWLAAKHEEARRALPPASRCAVRSCNSPTLASVHPPQQSTPRMARIVLCLRSSYLNVATCDGVKRSRVFTKE